MPQQITDTDGALFERLRPRLIAISRRVVGSEAEAEEIVQDCFLRWQNAERAALNTPVAWLTTVVRHQSIDRLRKRTRDTLAAHAALDLTPAASVAAPEHDLLRRAELGEALAHLLARLTPAERLTLVLHEVFECEHADIAQVLGTKPVNTRQHLARARRRLRQADNDTALPAHEQPGAEHIQRFQRALTSLDVPALLTLLGEPVALHAGTQPQPGMRACANDGGYGVLMAA
ncbi:sigma-70 family RNA polymerase sigma factor [Silvimonas iriomotensis]|uniref:RNA polymerase sigma-70 factor, ECF subfamily n=1 Tax=Silvimonas iriomotensis TaxID=449662 RepID=A0ABQ2P3Z0_9NEIS|nr:sigma-70 family RNA polymerase sigma factor [Silvimonas iriomotensis]GGP17727.1 hypothetical protein GCM10010970_01200 [Silvimonas iriomotensis]